MTYDDGRTPQWLASLATEAGGLLGMSLDEEWSGPGVRMGIAGDGLYLRQPYNKRGYVEVSGWFPPHAHGDCKPIRVRGDRGARVLAAEIERRLLPAYRVAVEEAFERTVDDITNQQARDRLAGYITGLFPAGKTSMPAHCQTSSRSEVIVYLPGALGGYVKISLGAHEVEFERFRVPAATALRMLETAALLTVFDEEAV